MLINMSNVWFSADAHYGHKRIIEYCDRPFESVDEMDRALIENWNEVVQPEDDVYFLGDFTLNFKYVKEVVPLLRGPCPPPLETQRPTVECRR